MQRLIQANGQPHYGIFPSAPQHINYRDFDFRSPMGRRVGALGKWRRFHQFQYFGLISPELIGGCALAQLSLLGVGFVYLYQPSSGRMLERRFKLPLGFGTRFSQTPDDGVCELRQGATCYAWRTVRLPGRNACWWNSTMAPASTPASARRRRASSRCACVRRPR